MIPVNENRLTREYRAVQRAAWLVIAGSCSLCFAAAAISLLVH